MYAIALALCVLILSGSSAFAQDQQAASRSGCCLRLSIPRLQTSIGRIRLKLSDPADTKSALRIERIIEVVGVAPPIELWNPKNDVKALRGPSPFGAPTQKEILDLTTPQEFKAEAIDISALLRWLADRCPTESPPNSHARLARSTGARARWTR